MRLTFTGLVKGSSIKTGIGFKIEVMDLSWKNVCHPNTWAALTEDEKAEKMLFMNKTSFTPEEVKTMLDEQRKYIASKFKGSGTLISNKVCEMRVLHSNEYIINLKIGVGIKENAEKI